VFNQAPCKITRRQNQVGNDHPTNEDDMKVFLMLPEDVMAVLHRHTGEVVSLLKAVLHQLGTQLLAPQPLVVADFRALMT